HGRPVAVLDIVGDLLEVRHAADALSVDLPDDVPALQARLGRGAVLLDAEDDDALGALEVELPGHLRGDRADVPAEHALALVAGLEAGRGPAGVADLALERLLPLVAPGLHRHALAGRRERNHFLKVLGAVDLLLVELGDDVARDDAGLGSGAVLHDV